MDGKAKTIATIDVNFQFDPREKFLEDQAFCPLCGEELLITHVTHFLRQEVDEEAHCEKCQVRVRQEQHHLQ